MSNNLFIAVLHKEEDGFSIWFPDVPGCVSQGDDIPDAIENAKNALSLFFVDAIVNKTKKPAQLRDISDIDLEEGEFTTVIDFDFVSYMKKESGHAVKKTLTIPSWLNSLAEENNISCSAVLKQALMEKLNLV